MYLAREAQGCGYATEAGEAVIAHAFRRLQAEVFRDYLSLRQARAQLGFRPVGRMAAFSRGRNGVAPAVRLRLERRDWETADGLRIETPRLILDAYRLEDAVELARLGDGSEVSRMLLFIPHPFSEANAARRIRYARFRGRPGFRRAVRLKDGTLVGEVGNGRRALAARRVRRP